MNDDYLWDKSGEPDPQIQELEQILGTLRYQPRPLEIPRELQTAPKKRRNYFRLLAIAASVLLALIAAGVWLRLRTENESQPQEAKVVPAAPASDEKAPSPRNTTIPQNISKPTVAVNNNRRRRVVSPALPEREREEALAAKEQLMLALRLTSEKLNLVHRKTQSPTPANQIKNQHRVG